MVDLIARQPFTYARHALRVGDRFAAHDRDVRILLAIGRAKYPPPETAASPPSRLPPATRPPDPVPPREDPPPDPPAEDEPPADDAPDDQGDDDPEEVPEEPVEDAGGGTKRPLPRRTRTRRPSVGR